jgi:ectoine hydroxylase
MLPEAILAHPARVLSQAQRERYFETGYLLVPSLIDAATLDALDAATARFVEQSRAQAASDRRIDVGPGHSAERPVVRRLIGPDLLDPVYWDFARGVIADVAADLLGPDVTYHHSKLNFKWSDGRDDVKWHQDIPFYPHTNYNVLAVGCYLTDVAQEDGPIAVIPGSHRGPVHEHFDERGVWTGAMRAADVARLDTASAESLPGPRGSITIHHSRAVHGSRPTTRAAGGRPLLINAYAAADAFPYTPAQVGLCTPHYRHLVRGAPARWAHHDPLPCPVPPDWSGGYTSIYAHQAGEAACPTPRTTGARSAA